MSLDAAASNEASVAHFQNLGKGGGRGGLCTGSVDSIKIINPRVLFFLFFGSCLLGPYSYLWLPVHWCTFGHRPKVAKVTSLVL